MARALRFLLPALLAAAGVVVLVVDGDTTPGTAVGFALIAVGMLVIVAMAFYEVGRSEDRERERSRRP